MESMSSENFKEKFGTISEKEYLGHKKLVYSVDWSCTGNRLASASQDFSIRVRYEYLIQALEFGKFWSGKRI